ncbi:hypothetical protein AFERRI_400392 [Acidithiobacillus ferrivorans]|uniref:Uncharacterized protein n=1 Tax=Acidithiobacillus ferrivorans TaxID=160808 RepID=A0A060UQR0_9PROT|nr:hypothetical protein AFERRI_400392 [Acidithiobacillus ferrivorans]
MRFLCRSGAHGKCGLVCRIVREQRHEGCTLRRSCTCRRVQVLRKGVNREKRIALGGRDAPGKGLVTNRGNACFVIAEQAAHANQSSRTPLTHPAWVVQL